MMRAFIALLSSLAVAVPAATADELWTTAISKKIDLLAGRLVVAMPKEAKIEPRGHSIMAAPQPDESETRVVLESSGAKLVLMATDLHAFAGKDFSQGVDRLIKQWQDDKQPSIVRTPATITTEGGLQAVLIKLSDASSEISEALLISSAVIANSDNTVQYLAVYANPVAAKQWSRVSKLADQILKSTTAGSSPTQTERRTVTVDDLLNLSINVPEASSVSTQIGPDFKVFRCFKMRPLGEEPMVVSIYVGHHPNFRPNPKAAKATGMILGQKVDWFKLNNKDGTQESETLLRLPTNPGVILHISLMAGNQPGLESMKTIAESLSIASPKTAPRDSTEGKRR